MTVPEVITKYYDADDIKKIVPRGDAVIVVKLKNGVKHLWYKRSGGWFCTRPSTKSLQGGIGDFKKHLNYPS